MYQYGWESIARPRVETETQRLLRGIERLWKERQDAIDRDELKGELDFSLYRQIGQAIEYIEWFIRS